MINRPARKKGRFALCFGLGCLVAWGCCAVESRAQDPKPEIPPAREGTGFDEQSLALRTALHYDPALKTSINSLVSLYQKADRIEELIGLYRAHIAQYPDDPGAKTVLIQILRKLNRIEAEEMIQAAVRQHPDNSLVQFLYYEYRANHQDDRALESLSRAIDLETKASRRDAWLEILLEEAGEGPERALAEGHLNRILAAVAGEGYTVEALISLADRMHRFGFDQQALAALSAAEKKEPNAEAGVEIDVLWAKCLAASGDRASAGVRLEALIGRVGADHWRRSEIMSLRINLLSSDAERQRLLSEARIRFEASPENETAVLEYAELLYASEERIKAAEVLIDAGKALPNSDRIEAETLKVLDRLGDDQKIWEYLTARLELSPERADLRYRLIKSAYILGKTDQASEDLEMVLAQLESDEERHRRLLELARHLTRVSLNKEAAALFGRVLVADPGRFDVRRELAETHIANEDRLSAALVLRDLPVEDAAIENFTDLVLFMMDYDFLLEARQALEKRLELEPDNFELRLYLVNVLGKTGDRTEAETLLLDARNLADTPARYEAWLKAGLSVHELFDNGDRFFDNEQARFFAGDAGEQIEWTPDRIKKFLSFCEIGKQGKLESRVIQALRNQIADGGAPADLRAQLRNLLVKALEKSQDHAAEVEQQLKLLAEEDVANADQYELRRALLYHTMQRPDLAQDLMASVKIENVRNTGVLRAAAQVLIEYGLYDKARACLEGVTNEDPDDLNNWERRMTLLAALGHEDELRKAIRHLLAGVDQINLSSQSLEALQLHLLDSYWRTIAGLLAEGSSEAYAEIKLFLEAVDRETLQPHDRLWSLWVRAHVANVRGNLDGRDGAIDQLVKLAGGMGDADSEPVITFPDGLSVTVKAAIELLRETPEETVEIEKAGDRQEGPLDGFEMAWAFEADPGAKILQIESIPGGLLVLDDHGTVYRVAESSGKLIWRERFGFPDEPRDPAALSRSGTGSSGGGITISNRFYQVKQQGASIRVQQLVAPYQAAAIGPGSISATGTANTRPADQDVSEIKLARRFETDGNRFYLAFGEEIRSYSVADASLNWAATVGPGDRSAAKGGSSALAHPGMRMTAKEGRLLAFLPGTGTAACFDAEGGKLLWMREFPAVEDPVTGAGDSGQLFSLNSGVAFSAGQLFVFGRRSMILDSETGDVIWSFEGGGVRAFPVDLVQARDAEAAAEQADPASMPTATGGLARPGYLDHLTVSGIQPDAVRSFLQYRGALVAPAVSWSGSRLSEAAAASAVIDSGRLLLMGADGVRQVSLRLPLASRQFEMSGVFLGLAGSRAWFLNGAGLTQIDLNGGEVLKWPVHSIDNPAERRAVLSGSRVYVIGDRGVTVLNAHSGNRITEMRWPEEFISFREKSIAVNDPMATGEEPLFLWQGISRQRPGLPRYCLPIIDRIGGPYLFTLVDDSRIAAIRSREAEPETPAP